MKTILDDNRPGALHPMTRLIADATAAFAAIGYVVADGPEVETEHYNFDALNIPADHPARDMWDTFWVKGDDKDGNRRLLRTHTSPVQVRYMENHKPPIRIISPGKVFRHEATDATHEAQFFQMEGLCIDESVSMADLKGTLLHYFKAMLGPDAEVRFRPSYFPFVEPAVEIDVKFRGKWLEVMGAGMVHPKVLEACGIDATKYQGFAFGGGMDRILMIKHGVPDIRAVYSGDARFVDQFRA
jgi:phenylalanyl-tRNA synthetase alpha chain